MQVVTHMQHLVRGGSDAVRAGVRGCLPPQLGCCLRSECTIHAGGRRGPQAAYLSTPRLVRGDRRECGVVQQPRRHARTARGGLEDGRVGLGAVDLVRDHGEVQVTVQAEQRQVVVDVAVVRIAHRTHNEAGLLGMPHRRHTLGAG